MIHPEPGVDMVKRKIISAVLLMFMLVYGCIQADGSAETLPVVTHLEGNRFSCSFDGVKHDFILDLPKKTEGAPLVLMLPGYGNTAESFRSSVHFEEDAIPLGYAVAYVTGAPNPNDPVSAVGWNSGISADGNDDTAFLTSLAAYLQREYGFDGKRIFAVGFSNGAFMVHRLAAEAADTFSAFVSVAGAMPVRIWNERKETNDISFFQTTGEQDHVVPKNSDGSAETSKDPAIEDVMSYWAESGGLYRCESEEAGNGSLLTKCGDKRTRNQVWSLFVKNGRHSWPGMKLNGIDTNLLILEFFKTVSP